MFHTDLAAFNLLDEMEFSEEESDEEEFLFSEK